MIKQERKREVRFLQAQIQSFAAAKTSIEQDVYRENILKGLDKLKRKQWKFGDVCEQCGKHESDPTVSLDNRIHIISNNSGKIVAVCEDCEQELSML